MPGEFALIEQLLRQASTGQALLGPGDDCALVRATSPDTAWAVTTDMLVEGVHFLATDHPQDLGWKTLAVNLSDLAAMGATPRFVTLAAAIPATDAQHTDWIESFFSGFTDCARAYDVELIGGDTTRGPRTFSVTAMGEVTPAQALRRSGAQVGDDLWVSGTPGYAALGLRHQLDQLALPEAVALVALPALHRPQPRVALGLALRDIAHSAIDISDGLLQDLGHITRASGLGAILYAAQLPPCPPGIAADLWQQCLLGGGDDYELLFSAPAHVRTGITDLAQHLQLPLTRIGQLHQADALGTIQLLDAAQQPLDLSGCMAGFDHFA